LGVGFNLAPFKKELDLLVENIKFETEQRAIRAELTVTTHLQTLDEKQKQLILDERNKLDELLKTVLGGKITIDKAIEFKITSKDFENVGDEATGLFPDLQKKLDNAADKLSTDKLTKSIKSIFDGLPKPTFEFNAEIKAKNKAQAIFDTDFWNKVFGFNDQAQRDEFDKQLGIFTNKALEGADTLIDSEIKKTDFLLSETQKRYDGLLAIQEGGNVEQLNLEQSRLDKLNEKRQKDLKDKQAINQAQILLNNALTISEGIKAVTQAFGENLFVGLATSLALAATVFSTISTLGSAIESIPAFKEGTQSVGDAKSGMKPALKTKDNLKHPKRD